MTIKQILSTLFSVSALLVVSSQAEAKSAFGLSGGWAFPITDVPFDYSFNGGVSFDAAMGNKATLGVFAAYQMTKEATILTAKVQPTMIPMGVTANYYLGNMPGLYLGANGGYSLTRTKTTFSGTSSTTSTGDLFVGGQIGFDFPISSGMSLGAEGKYIYILADTAQSLILAQAQLKFWF